MILAHNFPHLRLTQKRSNVNVLILSTFFRIAGISMLSLFSSIFIYTSSLEEGFSHKNAILWVILFYTVLFIFKFIFLFIGQKYSLKKGFKHTIWLSMVPMTIFIPLIIISEHFLWLMPVSALFWGAHAGLFWWGYHGYFVKTQKREKYGETIGVTLFVYTFASVIMPIIGALLIESFGYGILYVVSYLLMVVSMLVLAGVDDIAQKHDVNLKAIMKLAKEKSSLFWAYTSRGMSVESYSTFWQLWLFFLFGQVLDLGIVASLSLLLTSFIMIFVGRYVDKHGEKKTILIASPFLSLAWLARFFIDTIFGVVAINTVAATSGRATSVAMDEYAYREADTGHTSPALMLREVGVTFGAILTLIFGTAIVVMGLAIKWVFVLISVVTLIPIYFSQKYATKK